MSQKTLESLTPPDAREHEKLLDNAAPDNSAAEAAWQAERGQQELQLSLQQATS